MLQQLSTRSHRGTGQSHRSGDAGHGITVLHCLHRSRYLVMIVVVVRIIMVEVIMLGAIYLDYAPT